MSTSPDSAIVIGAGVGGLVAAVELAARGVAVTVVERAEAPGGKMRRVAIGDTALDGGPTVLTMRRVFDSVFEAAGARLGDHVTLEPAEVLARHAWVDGGRLDLFADIDRTAEAIGTFAGPDEARRYRTFCERSRRIYETLERPFLDAARPSMAGLVADAARRGPAGLANLFAISPFATLWGALGRDFRDPRLRQLYARYATYCGSSPFAAPATLMLVAHVEREGVWRVAGGMHALARALAGLAETLGARLRYSAPVTRIRVEGGRARGVVLENGERLEAGAVVCNADVAALSSGLLGDGARRAVPRQSPARRSLSAVVWTLKGRVDDFPLAHHNVFFCDTYRAEFDDIFRNARLPRAPTVYVCAQDRGEATAVPDGSEERLYLLVNAPATADTRPPPESEIESCRDRALALLDRCGARLSFDPAAAVTTGPAEFARLFPGTGGALYGRATHGPIASFARPGSRSRIPGLYLAGGSAHPGPGVPMAALSGRAAAASLLADLARAPARGSDRAAARRAPAPASTAPGSTSRSAPAATPGGTSTR
ncbi:MAG: phytoene desaturase family protein [Azospirillaceae bacterium]